MPPLLARQMLNRVKGLGLLGSVFAPETMQDAKDAAMKQIQGMVTLGSSAQSDAMRAQAFTRAQDAALIELIMNHPETRKRLINVLAR